MPDYPPGADLTVPAANAVPARDRDTRAAVPNLGALLAILRRHFWVWLLTTTLVPLAGIVAIERIPREYTATGALIYEPNEFKAQALQSVLREGPTTEATLASQAEILQSLHIAQRVAEQGHLERLPEFNAALRPLPWWRRLTPPPEPLDPGMYGPFLDPNREAMLLAVKQALHAKSARFSRVLEVTFTAHDPLVAAAAVNAAMDVYIKDQYAAKASAARKATEHLRTQAATLRRDTEAREAEIADYRAKHHLFQGMHADLDAEQVSHLSEMLAQARGELANAEARLDAARGRAGAGAQAAIAPSVERLRAQQDQLAAQAQTRQERLGVNHPDSLGLRRQANAARQSLSAEIERVVASIGAERRAAQDRVAALEANLRAAQEKADLAAKAQIHLNARQRDADAIRAQLQAVLLQIQDTAQKAATETSEAHEITTAVPPAQPSWPNAGPMTAAVCFAGIVFGLMAVYARHLLDNTVNGGSDARSVTGLPCFALLPEVGKRALGHLRVEDYVARRPLTAFAEQIRGLRAGLWLGAHRPRIIAIAAARPGEGKTVLTLSLGRSAQLAGEKVLLIECDLRQPKFARIFGADGEPGLAEVLRGAAELADVVRADEKTGLSYIPAGKPGGDMLKLFMSDGMTRLLASVRDAYDLILLDTPPIQAMSEARVTAAIADAVLLCVRWRNTPRAVLRHAFELLRESHANVAGTVVTRVDPRAHVHSGAADAEVYHRRYRAYYR